MKSNRREFIGGMTAFAAVSGFGGAKLKDGFKWAFMPQFGMNMWGDIVSVPKRNGGQTKLLTDEEYAAISNPEYHRRDAIRFDETLWKSLSAKLKSDGCNMILVDLGEFLTYPSHPELAVKGSWSADRMRAEVQRLKGMGFDVMPKINFSCCHDTWLKEYARMISTPKYYEVTADIIRDVYEIFDKPQFIHLGLDEEDIVEYQSRNTSLVRMRQGDLWWHDANYFFSQVEKHGARAWIWSDYLRRHPVDDFLKRMPKTVVQSPWAYDISKPDLSMPRIKLMKTMADNGYDVFPCGSNCYGVNENFQVLTEFCRDNLPAEHFLGMLMAPWISTRAPYGRLLNEASCLVAETIRRS